MPDIEKVIKGLECCVYDHCDPKDCPYYPETDGCEDMLIGDALALLKEQEPLMVEQPKPVDLEDEVKAWLDKMDAVDALASIADICIDWDGYRTADGLGGLINEIWAYARYQANRLLKGREPRVMTLEEIPRHDGSVFFEVRNKGEWVVFSSWDRNRRSKWMTFAFGSNYGHITSFNIDVYGKFWRCWTSRPTDEQREEVKWE